MKKRKGGTKRGVEEVEGGRWEVGSRGREEEGKSKG